MKIGNEVWEKQPIYNVIYSIVRKEKTISFEELVNKVREEYQDIDEERIRTALMKLEIWDKVKVISNGHDKRITLKG